MTEGVAMGVAKSAAKILLAEAKARPFHGSALLLGRQFVTLSERDLREAAQSFGVRLQPTEVKLSQFPELAAQEYLSDRSLFELLGFSQVQAMDASEYEDADFIHDLNDANVPSELIGAFDFILDSGTIEHIFHLPNVMLALFRMLKPGGRIVHITPSSNYLDHGLYMFSPTWFADFYSANQWTIHTLGVVRHSPWPSVHPWEVYAYRPGAFTQFGGLDDSMYAILCIVEKGPEATGDRIPQQGEYVRDRWQTTPSAPGKGKATSVKQQVRRLLYQYPPLLRLVLTVRHRTRSKRVPLPLIGRY
jgi:SAM-dependent methyltransferase